MIPSLDISPLFTSDPKSFTLDDYEFWRPYFYANLDPTGVLLGLSGPQEKASKPRRGRSKGVSSSLKATKVDAEEKDPLVWLTSCRSLLLASGGSMTAGVVGKMGELLLGAIGSYTSPREKAQLAYMLRGLSFSGDYYDGGMPVLYAVVFEFDVGDGPTLIYASSDGSASMYWVGGAIKWASYDGGEGADISQRIHRVSSESLPALLEDVDSTSPLPPKPKLGYIRISYVTSRGLVTKLYKRSDLMSSTLLVYRHFVLLFRALVGDSNISSSDPLLRAKASDRASHLPLPLKLLTPHYSGVGLRAMALFVDVVFFGMLFSLFSYFLYPIVSSWGGMVVFLFYIAAGFSLMPLCFAWMESSQEWGYRTIGKRLFSLRVHTTSNSDLSSGPTFPQALARNCFKYFISPPFFCVGYLWAAYHPFVRTWHDLVGDTVVLNQNSKIESVV